jgi:uncharacterized membrane protein
VLGRPRAPWRDTYEDALADAVRLKLASWDASGGEWFLTASAILQTRRVPTLVVNEAVATDT